jgi:hypothetical protein
MNVKKVFFAIVQFSVVFFSGMIFSSLIYYLIRGNEFTDIGAMFFGVLNVVGLSLYKLYCHHRQRKQ